jgi:murein tripeptide amidase MpaA
MTYYNVTEVESALKGLRETYPSLCQRIRLPNKTHEGRTSYALRIGLGLADNRPAMLFIGGQHAREWGSSEICINFAADLLEAYTLGTGLIYGGKSFSDVQIKQVVETLHVIIFPCVNPDGRHYSQTVDASWRRNRNPIAPVDVNRNYDFLWDFRTAFSSDSIVYSYVSDNPTQITYHGTAPESEPETRNVVWLLDTFPQIRWFIDIHCYSGMISRNWGDDENQTTDRSMNFLNSSWDHQRGVIGDAYGEYIDQTDRDAAMYLAHHMNQALNKVRGKSYRIGQSFSLPYPTSGTSDDYAYSRHFADPTKTKTLGFLIEWGTEFQPPWIEMENIILDISAVLLEFAVKVPHSQKEELGMTLDTPWAILLCKWKDMPIEAKPRSFFEELFTAAGRGTQNMADYFDDVSHRHVNIGGSQVFGWLTLPQNRSDYKGSGSNPQGRYDLINWAKMAANAAGVDLSPFFNVVICLNATSQVGTDLFGCSEGIVCDTNTLHGAVLGQEMGHVYGLDHSRQDGTSTDYTDRWDVMSTWNSCYMSYHYDYKFIGPGLNAANMAGRGWLDESRVWSTSNSSFDTVVQLRPLFRPDLPGFLAARFGEYIAEFRTQEGWDASIPRPAVLIHRFEDNHSYLMSGRNGEQDLVKGSSFSTADPFDPFTSETGLDVIAIDPNDRFATVRLIRSPRREPRFGPAIVFGGVAEDGGGFVIVGGKFVRIPPRSPLLKILEQIVTYESSESIASIEVRNTVRRETLSSIKAIVEKQTKTMQIFKQPAPLHKVNKNDEEV